MRFLSLRAVALCAGFYLWMSADLVEAQPLGKISKGSGIGFNVRSRPAVSPGGSGGGGPHQEHSHHVHHHGFGCNYSYGGFYPYGSSYYSSYSSYYAPFGSSFFYGTVYPGYGGYNSGWGYPAGIYPAPTYQYFPTPLLTPYAPPITQPLIDLQAESEARWAEDLKLGSQIRIPIKAVIASSTQEKLRAQRLQISGDELFREQSFSQAMRQYRQANSVAQDLPGPYYRMGIVYAIQGKFDAAVTYLKRTLELDPAWPTKGDSLTMLYGEDNYLARNALLIEVSNWVEQDIRDPDRSFLMGVLLYEFDPEKAATFLEASARLSGTTRYVSPYLSPVAADDPQNPPANLPANPPDANDAPAAPPQPERDDPAPPIPQQDPTLNQEQSNHGLKIVPAPPPNIGFTTPRQGKVVTPIYIDPRKGPEFPPQGN